MKKKLGVGRLHYAAVQEKWNQDCIEPPVDLKKDVKVMFWRHGYDESLTDLPGDPESKGGGVRGRIILYAFKKILPQLRCGDQRSATGTHGMTRRGKS